MKKLINISILAALFTFWSCEDVTDDFKGLDDKSSVKNEQQLEGVFTDEAYEEFSKIALSMAKNAEDTSSAKAIATDLALNSRWTADIVVPEYLINIYYSIDKGSSFNGTYNNNVGRATYLSSYENAETFYLTNDDYAIAGDAVEENSSFFPSTPASKYMNDILIAKYPNATKDELVNAIYDFSPIDGASAEIYFNEEFSSYSNYDVVGESDNWTQKFTKGSREWLAREYGGNTYAQFSSYNSGEENEVYLITPAIDIEDDEPIFSFDVNIGYWTHDPLEIYISNDYNGSNFESATWKNVTSNFTIPSEPNNGYGTFATAGQMVIEDYSGTIYIAFKYIGDGNSSLTTTVQIDNLLVKSTGIDKTQNSDMYQFDGSEWNEVKNMIVLDESEYDSMGAPGKYNNFSSSVNPKDYLPTYLQQQMPYAQNGDSLLIGYKYYNDGVNFVVDTYFFKNQSWIKKSEIIEESQQFIFDGSKWLFDPSVTFDLAKSDYQTLVDYVTNSTELKKYLDDKYPNNTEDYFGSSAFYGNFNFRLKDRSSNDEEVKNKNAVEVVDILLNRIITEGLLVILEKNYPNSESIINGVDVYYYPIIHTYQEGNVDVYYKVKYKCTGPGKFELVVDEKPEIIEK